jgi:hypothetical protein
MKQKKNRLFSPSALLILLVSCAPQSTLMKGIWQSNDHISPPPPAKHILGKWQAKNKPFTLTLEPRSDSDGCIAFTYKNHSIYDDTCLLSAWANRPTYETESITLRFFADNLKVVQPALEITGTVAGDSLVADVAFKYDNDIATEVWKTTLYRVQ